MTFDLDALKSWCEVAQPGEQKIVIFEADGRGHAIWASILVSRECWEDRAVWLKAVPELLAEVITVRRRKTP